MSESMAQVPYRLPRHAIDYLGRDAGVPWADAQRFSGANIFLGIMRNSMQFFPNAPRRALMWESKFDICQDGREMRVKGDTFIGDTALHEADGRPFNAFQFPYGVIPLTKRYTSSGHKRCISSLRDRFGVDLGDLGICFWRGLAVPFLFGDLGPSEKIGEGSVFLAEQLGINSDPVRGGYQKLESKDFSNPEGKRGIIWLAFPGSRKVSAGKTQHTITTLSAEAFELLAQFTDARADRG